MRKIAVSALLALAGILTFTACEKTQYDRIPIAGVRIEFGNAAVWNVYGVSAYPDHREFIKEENLPRGFTYVANSATGYGGVMLLCDPVNTILAYDMACPVERSSKVRIEYDEENFVLRCNSCGSTYDVATGSPLSGPANSNRYFLQQYSVFLNAMSGGCLVTR